MKRISILGSTGSIGTQTLEVVEQNKDLEVTALAAGSNIALLEAQIRKFRPSLAAVWSEEKAKELKARVADGWYFSFWSCLLYTSDAADEL